MNEYVQQAEEFLARANAKMKIDFRGVAINTNWDDKKRNMYKITLTTPHGKMIFDFWDSIQNTEICAMSLQKYAEKRYKIHFDNLTNREKVTAQKELRVKQAAARPTAYDVLAVMTKYDPGAFEDFCADFGYDTDSRRAERIYFAVQKEYHDLARIFTPKQMEELAEIQ